LTQAENNHPENLGSKDEDETSVSEHGDSSERKGGDKSSEPPVFVERDTRPERRLMSDATCGEADGWRTEENAKTSCLEMVDRPYAEPPTLTECHEVDEEEDGWVEKGEAVDANPPRLSPSFEDSGENMSSNEPAQDLIQMRNTANTQRAEAAVQNTEKMKNKKKQQQLDEDGEGVSVTKPDIDFSSDDDIHFVQGYQDPKGEKLTETQKKSSRLSQKEGCQKRTENTIGNPCLSKSQKQTPTKECLGNVTTEVFSDKDSSEVESMEISDDDDMFSSGNVDYSLLPSTPYQANIASSKEGDKNRAAVTEVADSHTNQSFTNRSSLLSPANHSSLSDTELQERDAEMSERPTFQDVAPSVKPKKPEFGAVSFSMSAIESSHRASPSKRKPFQTSTPQSAHETGQETGDKNDVAGRGAVSLFDSYLHGTPSSSGVKEKDVSSSVAGRAIKKQAQNTPSTQTACTSNKAAHKTPTCVDPKTPFVFGVTSVFSSAPEKTPSVFDQDSLYVTPATDQSRARRTFQLVTPAPSQPRLAVHGHPQSIGNTGVSQSQTPPSANPPFGEKMRRSKSGEGCEPLGSKLSWVPVDDGDDNCVEIDDDKNGEEMQEGVERERDGVHPSSKLEPSSMFGELSEQEQQQMGMAVHRSVDVSGRGSADLFDGPDSDSDLEIIATSQQKVPSPKFSSLTASQQRRLELSDVEMTEQVHGDLAVSVSTRTRSSTEEVRHDDRLSGDQAVMVDDGDAEAERFVLRRKEARSTRKDSDESIPNRRDFEYVEDDGNVSDDDEVVLSGRGAGGLRSPVINNQEKSFPCTSKIGTNVGHQNLSAPPSSQQSSQPKKMETCSQAKSLDQSRSKQCVRSKLDASQLTVSNEGHRPKAAVLSPQPCKSRTDPLLSTVQLESSELGHRQPGVGRKRKLRESTDAAGGEAFCGLEEEEGVRESEGLGGEGGVGGLGRESGGELYTSLLGVSPRRSSGRTPSQKSEDSDRELMRMADLLLKQHSIGAEGLHGNLSETDPAAAVVNDDSDVWEGFDNVDMYNPDLDLLPQPASPSPPPLLPTLDKSQGHEKGLDGQTKGFGCETLKQPASNDDNVVVIDPETEHSSPSKIHHQQLWEGVQGADKHTATSPDFKIPVNQGKTSSPLVDKRKAERRSQTLSSNTRTEQQQQQSAESTGLSRTAVIVSSKALPTTNHRSGNETRSKPQQSSHHSTPTKNQRSASETHRKPQQLSHLNTSTKNRRPGSESETHTKPQQPEHHTTPVKFRFASASCSSSKERALLGKSCEAGDKDQPLASKSSHVTSRASRSAGGETRAPSPEGFFVDEGDLEAANSSFMWSEENAPTEEEVEVVAATSQPAEKTEVSGNYLCDFLKLILRG
jgi:hypothetical protein